MTDEEALALGVGTRVLVRMAGKKEWETATIERTKPWRSDEYTYGSQVKMVVRPDGFLPNGQHRNRIRRFADEVRRPLDLDPVTANVFADWLDERGEHRAAAILRETFPVMAATGPEG